MLHSVPLIEATGRSFATLAASETASTRSELDILEWVLAKADTGRRRDLARVLVSEFRTLNDCLSASAPALLGVGLTPEMVVEIQTAWRLVGHVLASRFQERHVLNSFQAVRDYLRINMADKPVEMMRALYLDAQWQLLRDEVMQVGTINRVWADAREVAHRALNLGAVGLVLAHNHPSGVDKPSRSDIDMTHELKAALHPLGIRLHDHVIVGKNQTTSLAEMGLYSPA